MNTGIKVSSGARSGFTLVEVIVVAVIVAILAAVAIPMYNGHVRESRENAAHDLAETAAAAANAFWRRAGNAAEGALNGQHAPNTQPLMLHFRAEAYTVTVNFDGGFAEVAEVGSRNPIEPGRACFRPCDLPGGGN